MEISEIIALFSLAVAFFAYKHAVTSSAATSKQIHLIAEDHLKLSSNIALTEASQKYVLLLNEVNQDLEGIIKELSYPALKASTEIGEALEQYDNATSSSPSLRHCFHNAITVVREAYDQELTFQTGSNLVSRIRHLKFIKDDVSNYEKFDPEKSIFSFLKKEEPPKTPEQQINRSTVFWDAVKEIYSRVPSNKECEYFRDTLEILSEYRQLHESKHQLLEDLERKLEAAIKENALEMFDIRDIPNLGSKFYRVKGDIGRIRELHFPDLQGVEEYNVSDGIAYSVYAASVVFLTSQHFMWGKI
jgi:hypothetical protein